LHGYFAAAIHIPNLNGYFAKLDSFVASIPFLHVKPSWKGAMHCTNQMMERIDLVEKILFDQIHEEQLRKPND
jgi:hypothetical protein